MARDPILTIGDLEPERPTVAINRNAPDGAWQAFKHRHFDILLRWFPVRYRPRHDEYPLRLPSEFGLARIARLNSLRAQVAEYEGRDDEAATRRVVALLRELAGMVLDAPASVIASLPPEHHARIVAVFPQAVRGQLTPPDATESPSTSEPSSPASAASTAPTTG